MRVTPALLLLLGCAGGAGEEGTVDVRVEHTQKSSTAESDGARSCMAGGNRLYAAWNDDRGGVDGVWFNASVDGGLAWQEADTDLTDAEAPATAVDLACGGDDVWVVWEDARDGELANHNIYFDHSADGGVSWGEADVPLDADVEGDAMSLGPRVVAAGDDVYVAWFDARDGAYDIYLQASRDRGQTWLAAPTRVDADAEGEAYSAWPRLAADGEGTVLVVWEDSRSGGSDIYANVSTDHGATFAASDTRLDGGDDAGATDSFLPSVAMEGTRAYVVWHDKRFGNVDVLMNVSSDGGATWGEAATRVTSTPEGESDAMNPVVAAVDDRVHVAFQDDRAGGYDVYLRTSLDGGAAWSGDEVRMDTDDAGFAQSYAPVLALSGQTVLVAWSDRRDDTENVGFDDLLYNYSLDGGAHWNADDLRINSNAPGSAWAQDPSVHLHDDALSVVWVDGRFGSGDVFAALRSVGEESVYVEPEEEEAE